MELINVNMIYSLSLMVICLIGLLKSLIISEEETVETCGLEQFTISCLPNQVVLVTNASYGHLHLGRCVTLDLGHFGCGADVTSIVDERCSGKRQCQFDTPDQDIARSNPCNSALNPFLETSYRCLTGRQDRNVCQDIQVGQGESFMTSLATLRSRCSTQAGQYVTMTAPPGQRINLTVTDTKYNHLQNTSDYRMEQWVDINGAESMGNNQAVITDGMIKMQYESTGNDMEVVFLSSGNSHNIIVSFQAIGCLDYRPPSGMWQERSGDNVTVGCYSTDRTWTLQCMDSHWIGQAGNCSIQTTVFPSKATPIQMIKKGNTERKADLSREVIIVIILASTLVMCAIVVTSACLYIRCLKSKHECQSATKQRVQYALSPQDAALLLGNGIQDGAQRNSWHNTMPLPQNNDQLGAARKDYMTMNMLPLS